MADFKTIPLDHINVSFPVRHSTPSLEDLKASVKRNGIRTPLLVNPASMELISGYRRYRACVELRRGSVRVGFPNDVVDACTTLGDHVTAPADQLCAIPMSPRDRVNLAIRLNELSKPSDIPKRSFTRSVHTAPAVGMTPKSLRRVSRMIDASQEGQLDCDQDCQSARKTLAVMLSAIDVSPNSVDAERMIERIYAQFRRGQTPETISEFEQGSTGKCGSGQLEIDTPITKVATQRVRKRTFADFRMGIDQVSGGISGLVRFGLPEEIPPGSREYAVKEIKRGRQDLYVLLKQLQEM
ncbi:ParB/RepB/Spo0J family partition protein [Streptomyces sp. NPDC056670]|uniref:ParB/RepB/Spo0J family partition protein n=1 Tax=Streptomyces sp. NPDC056670 TaxID=3345904 RepID=UPI0036C45152